MMLTIVGNIVFLKIGASSNPERRLGEIRRGTVIMPPGWNGEAVWLVAVNEQCTFDDERWLHEVHALSRAAGEWFVGSSGLIERVLSYASATWRQWPV